jgi:hypothetical protein
LSQEIVQIGAIFLCQRLRSEFDSRLRLAGLEIEFRGPGGSVWIVGRQAGIAGLE